MEIYKDYNDYIYWVILCQGAIKLKLESARLLTEAAKNPIAYLSTKSVDRLTIGTFSSLSDKLHAKKSEWCKRIFFITVFFSVFEIYFFFSFRNLFKQIKTNDVFERLTKNSQIPAQY